MAVGIYNNPYAITAQNNLTKANSSLAKSIRNLSSGLRINQASDDASGLAVSEKLRGQIRGLQKAAMNAQDGISMLQTAEGGIEEITNMIQRMRELSVQAGNGIYTSNDRKELQKEVDQLKQEIDRISSATEFNTKKLLNGDATALWSSSSAELGATITGNVAEGNYKIEVSSNPGSNWVYKSDIMTQADGTIGAGIVGANTTGVGFLSDPTSLTKTTGTAYMTVTITGSAAGAITGGGTVLGNYAAHDSSWAVASVADIAYAAGPATGGYVEVEFLTSLTAGQSMTAGYTAGDVRVRYVDGASGGVSDWVDLQAANIDSAGFSLNNLSFNVEGVAVTMAAASGTVVMSLGTSGTVINAGDKLLLGFSAVAAATTVLAEAGGGAITTGYSNGAVGPTIAYTTAGSITGLDNGDNNIDYNAVTIYTVELDETTGNFNHGSFTLNVKENVSAASTAGGQTLTGAFSLQITGAGDVATSSTQLKDIARFINDDGINILDNRQELTIFGNGEQFTICIEGTDTLGDLAQKMTDALLALGMGATAESSSNPSSVNGNLVQYIAPGEEMPSGDNAVAGTFIIQSALMGDASKISFLGDQGLLDALSLAVITEGENSSMNITVYDAHTGDLVGTEKSGDGKTCPTTLIQGVSLDIHSLAGVNVDWNGTTSQMAFTKTAASSEYFFHVVDNSTALQIGANEGQSIDVSIPEINTKSLGIDDAFVITQDLASSAITKFDSALQKVNSVRATIGAQINRLESSIRYIDNAKENLIASESRIRDADIAYETTEFTRNQILTQASMSMLAQANQIPQQALMLLS